MPQTLSRISFTTLAIGVTVILVFFNKVQLISLKGVKPFVNRIIGATKRLLTKSEVRAVVFFEEK